MPNIRRLSRAWLALLFCATAPAKAASLPKLGADSAKVSVSGLSSGGFMAIQYGVAFSASTMGVAAVAGGPYNCAAVYALLLPLQTCMTSAPSGALSYNSAQWLALAGWIDPVANIAAQKVYLFSGSQDRTVRRSVMNGVRDFYAAAHVPADSLEYVTRFRAGHAFLSTRFGEACGATRAPFVNECPSNAPTYDQPKAILQRLYGPLQPETPALPAGLSEFDQAPDAPAFSGLAATGFVYVPPACRSARGCAVHVVFHGCAQSARDVGDAVYGRLGFNSWAEGNRIIMLYPQVDPKALPLNPFGCWDWWGYTGVAFQSQTGPQPAAVRAMVRALLSSD
jgi:poly(3-hydroxybutyrate) depolymerase